MIQLKEKTERLIELMAEKNNQKKEELTEELLQFAIQNLLKKVKSPRFDEEGIPYMDAEEEAEVREILKNLDPNEEEYTQEEVLEILGLKKEEIL